MSDRDKDAENTGAGPLDHSAGRQLGSARPRLLPSDRAFLAALLHRLPRDMLGRFRLLIRPDTVLRWHRNLLARRHAASSRPRRPVLGPKGQIRHQGGVTDMPGLYVIGTKFLRRRKSTLIDGVGDDARDLSNHLARHLASLSVH